MINLDDEKDQMAFDFMGNAYLVIPRSILERALSPEEQERQAGMLHLALLAKCYHSDGTVLLSGGKVPCRRGEFVGSLRNLAKLAHICPTSVYRQVARLVDQKLIIMNRIPGGSRVKVCGYDLLSPLREKENQPSSYPSKEKISAALLAEAEKKAGRDRTQGFPEIPFF